MAKQFWSFIISYTIKKAKSEELRETKFYLFALCSLLSAPSSLLYTILLQIP
jgi:hypothetical protein